MKRFTFNALLQNDGWLNNCTVAITDDGKVHAIEQDSEDKGEVLDGYAIPGFQNGYLQRILAR